MLAIPIILSALVSNWLTHSLRINSFCWDLTDVTMAFEDANLKFLDVVTVADFDGEKYVDDSLVEILKLNLGRDFEAFDQDF